ncbi:hypothetical protein TNCV_1373611 [Trichonephila clavipes]|uniref:Uncharacterized protein n=1 Tax=Trichonephila clavipes TaxID=2585209 RepID=A0A8X6WH04_TRICX|nr:hypothetical protein TNCV_1373611 [Trichonephila clavipes]
MKFHSWVDLTREVPESADHELQTEKVRVLSCLDRLDSQFQKHDTIQLMELLFEFWKLLATNGCQRYGSVFSQAKVIVESVQAIVL